MAFKTPFSIALGLLGVAFFCTLSVRAEPELRVNSWPIVEFNIRGMARVQGEMDPNPLFQDHKPCIDYDESVRPTENGVLASEAQRGLNDLAMEYLGRFCQSKKCYFHGQKFQFLCNSSTSI